MEPTQQKTIPHNAIRLGEALKALWDLRNDNDDTTHVFRIVDALRGNSDVNGTARMLRSDFGRRVIEERRSLIDLLSDRDRLRGLPEGSLGRVYLEFMEREGLSADGLAAAAERGYQRRSADPAVRTYSDWARDSHDLWHVLTGYGRDPLGELCLLGVLYSQIRNPGTAFIALLGLLQAPLEYPGAPCVRAVLQGFRIGRRSAWLMEQDWEALLPEPIDAVREQLNIGSPDYYRRAAPLHDPSRSRSNAARAAAAAGPAQAV